MGKYKIINFVKDYKFIIIFYFFIGFSFYIQNRFSIFCLDDYLYTFSFADSGNRINNLIDIIKSQNAGYLNVNGRYIIHGITHLFCSVIGKDIFEIFNSTAFVLLLIALSIYTIPASSLKNVGFHLIVFTLVWLLIPSVGETFLGNISTNINYLWVSLFVVLFLINYKKYKESNKETSLVHRLCLFFFSVFVGSLQESFSIGIAGALGLYYIFHFKELKGVIAFIVIGRPLHNSLDYLFV